MHEQDRATPPPSSAPAAPSAPEPGGRGGPGGPQDLVAALLGRAPDEVARLGSGTDHAAFLVGSDLVARVAHGPPEEVAADVEREAAVLHAVAGRLPVATPEVVAVHADAGVLVTTRVPGCSLLGRLPPPAGAADALADALAGVLTAIHTLPLEALGGAVGPDDYPLAAYAEDAMEHLAAVAPALGRATTDLLSGALRQVPEDAATSTFVHNDLGAEHLFTTGDLAAGDGALSGVIDWADAALADPARDVARVLRDVGPGAHRRVVERYDPGWDDHAEARAWFLARCAALEDLAYGLSTGRRAYADAAVQALTWLAAPGGGR